MQDVCIWLCMTSKSWYSCCCWQMLFIVLVRRKRGTDWYKRGGCRKQIRVGSYAAGLGGLFRGTNKQTRCPVKDNERPGGYSDWQTTKRNQKISHTWQHPGDGVDIIKVVTYLSLSHYSELTLGPVVAEHGDGWRQGGGEHPGVVLEGGSSPVRLQTLICITLPAHWTD